MNHRATEEIPLSPPLRKGDQGGFCIGRSRTPVAVRLRDFGRFCATPRGWACAVLVVAAGALTGYYFQKVGEGTFDLWQGEFRPDPRLPELAVPVAVFEVAGWAACFLALWWLYSAWAAGRTGRDFRDVLCADALAFSPLLLLLASVVRGALGLPISFHSAFAFICLASLTVAAKAWLLGRPPSLPGSRGTRASPLSNRLALGLACGVAAAFFLVFAILDVLACRSLYLGYHDTGVYAHILWNTIHGRVLQSNYYLFPNFLGDHFSPMLLAATPFYWLVPRAETLLVFQTGMLALGAVPVYLLGRDELGRPAAGLLFAVAYVLYPALGHANFNLIGGFNPDCLSVPFLLWAFHWACRRRWTGFFACAVGALLCKETVAPVVAAFSVFLWFRLRNGRAALATLALGVLWFALATGVVIPYFRGGSYDYIRLFYGDLGGQPGRVAAQVLAHPLSLAARLGSVDRVNFVVELLLPLAFLPLAAPSASAAGLPTLFCLLIADDASLHSILFHYRSSLIPVAFLGAICGARRTAAADRWRMTAAGLACAAFFSHYFLAPSPLSQSFDASLFKSTPRAEVVQDLRAAIPPDASVSATAKVALHFANRDNPYVAPNRADSADYVILDLVEPGREWRQAFLCRDRLLGDPRYGLRAFRDNILVFQKGLDERADRMKRLRFDADERLWRNGRQVNPHVKCLAVWFEPTASKSLGPVRECQMTVVWGCLKETDRDFCAAIAVGSPSSGYMVKGPYLPLYGVHPTFLWKVGEAFRETHTVQAPFDLSQAHSLPVGLHIVERVRADALARELEARYGPVVIWN